MQAVDFHCDTLSVLCESLRRGTPKAFLENDLHIDLNKLKKGDYLLQCFAAFINLKQEGLHPLASALEQIDMFYQIMEEFPDKIGPVKTWADLEENRARGRVSAMLTVEDGGCCLGNLSVLRVLYRLGVRIMTLTWNYENELGWPNVTVGENRENPQSAGVSRGLKESGFAFIREMERLGMIVDVSHLSDDGFWDVVRHTSRPFIASHSNARAKCSHVRNLTDEMLRAISERGGLTRINYCAAFLDEQDTPEKCRSTVSLMADHIEHIRQVGGIDMIGLGSDFDGIEKNLEMSDCSMLFMLEAELHRRHYSGGDIEKIFHANALRLLKEFL